MPSSRTFLGDDNRLVYERSAESAYINTYNPWLLAVAQCNMDIQINVGHNSLPYLCKYLTKFDTTRGYQMVDTNRDEEDEVQAHFHGRQVGAVEAVYDIFGWHKQQASMNVVYISTNTPDNEYRVIRRSEHMPQNEQSRNVTYKTHIGK